MTLNELISKLMSLNMPESTQVMALDNCSYLFDICEGPRLLVVEQKHAENTADAEDKVGQTIIAIGFGNY